MKFNINEIKSTHCIELGKPAIQLCMRTVAENRIWERSSAFIDCLEVDLQKVSNRVDLFNLAKN